MGKESKKVTILGVKGKCRVDQPKITVERGDTIEFYSQDLNSIISFPDPGIIDIKGCWKNIEKGGDPLVTTVEDSAVVGNTYYYAVMCEHDDGKYWYAQGDSAPRMIVGK